MSLKKRERKCLNPDEIIARLTKSGVQPTAQRIAICRFVLCEVGHPTAEDVKRWADKNFPKISLATVYNTLNLLVKAGLLKEVRIPDLDKSVYDNNMSKHHHFLDEETGQLMDLPAEQIKVITKLNKNLKIRDVDVIVRGTANKKLI